MSEASESARTRDGGGSPHSTPTGAASRRALLTAALAAGSAVPALLGATPAAAAPTTATAPSGAGARRGGDEISVASILPEVQTAAFRGRQYATPSKAAKAAGRSDSSLFRGYAPEEHLLRRATIGARPSDRADLARLGIDRWIAKQLTPNRIRDPHGQKAWNLFPLAGAGPAKIRQEVEEFHWDAVFETAQASLGRQIFSKRQIYEITVDIFSNHLHVPIPGEQWHTSPSYLKNVIRRHAFGSYERMLLAAMKHPAMLNYLDNDQSYKENVNENLGRELLELHTVGVDSGYTEEHVRDSARILSGRTWDWRAGTYEYNASKHATGRVRVLDFTHANSTASGGEAVGDAYLRYLAHHPSTARMIARKIAIRFVSDTPSPSLIRRLANVYLKNDTNIKAVVEAVFHSSDFWHAVGTRMRRPLEDAVGTLRVLDVRPTDKMRQPISWLYWSLNEAGHTPHGWGPPNGYPDVAAAWLSAGSMIHRWNLHRSFVYGWWEYFRYTKPAKLVPAKSGWTTRRWTRVLARRLLGVTPSGAHVRAIIQGARLDPDAPAPTDDWRCGKIAALILDSAYFQLR